MSYSNAEDKALDAVDMDTSINSTKIETRNIDHGSVQAVWTGASHADGNVALETSHDGTNWDAHSNMDLDTISAGATSKTLPFALLNFPWCRFVYTKGSNNTGTATLRYLFKSKK